MLDYRLVEDSDGFWNKVSREDREQAVNRLQRGAKSRFRKSGVLDEVDRSFARQIEDALDADQEPKVEVLRSPLP